VLLAVLDPASSVSGVSALTIVLELYRFNGWQRTDSFCRNPKSEFDSKNLEAFFLLA
jgi:hypothetical protein